MRQCQQPTGGRLHSTSAENSPSCWRIVLSLYQQVFSLKPCIVPRRIGAWIAEGHQPSCDLYSLEMFRRSCLFEVVSFKLRAGMFVLPNRDNFMIPAQSVIFTSGYPENSGLRINLKANRVCRHKFLKFSSRSRDPQ